MRVAIRLTAALAIVAGCGGAPAQRLGPAGSRYDDGTGQLAAASVRLQLGGRDEAQRDRYARRRQGIDDEDAGQGYGGDGYGGFGYGGFGYGGLGFGYTPPVPPPPPYTPASVVDGGSIVGSLRWRADAGITWPHGCGAARVARTGAPVADAVVYLDKVTSGRAVPYASAFVRTGGVAVVEACAIVPVVQTVSPLPNQLVIENADARATKLVGERAGLTTSVELEPGARGSLMIDRVGAFRVDDGRRAPAWVVGQAHPYYVVSAADGQFALDEIPPGNYELVVWVPPLVVHIGADGPRWTAPTIERRRVTVPRRGVARLELALTPAR